jgi:F5/8 type C domain
LARHAHRVAAAYAVYLDVMADGSRIGEIMRVLSVTTTILIEHDGAAWITHPRLTVRGGWVKSEPRQPAPAGTNDTALGTGSATPAGAAAARRSERTLTGFGGTFADAVRRGQGGSITVRIIAGALAIGVAAGVVMASSAVLHRPRTDSARRVAAAAHGSAASTPSAHASGSPSPSSPPAVPVPRKTIRVAAAGHATSARAKRKKAVEKGTASHPATTFGVSAARRAPSTVNLAVGRPVSVSSHTQNYVGSNIDDGNTMTYWESTANAFPQWVQLDLGSNRTVGRLVLSLPPVADWNQRTQTISVLGSSDGSHFTTLADGVACRFDARTGDFTAFGLPSRTARYLRLEFTANSGWYAAQLSEIGVYSS